MMWNVITDIVTVSTSYLLRILTGTCTSNKNAQ